MATIFATRSQESLLNPPPPPHDNDNDTREIFPRSQRAAMRKLVSVYLRVCVCVQLIEKLKIMHTKLNENSLQLTVRPPAAPP